MKTDKEKTKQFYETYMPCSCSDCKLYIKHIESLYPELCEGLKDFGIDPKKPYELISLYHPQEQRMEYDACVYLVVGTIEEDFKKTIGGLEITVAQQDQYPEASINNPYFFLTFGPVHIKSYGTSNRHLTYKEKLKLVLQAINEVDPMHLLSIGCPKDEYIQEAILILKEIQIKKSIIYLNWHFNWKKIRAIFLKQFNEELPYKICLELARKIAIYFNFKDYIRDFDEIESLKGKVSLENDELILKIHENFIVKYLTDRTLLINDKPFVKDLEEQDVLDFFCDFVNDEDVVYIQYKHKHFGFFRHPKLYYFTEMKSTKCSWPNVRHFFDVELVFDNRRVLYGINSKAIKELTEEEIIERMSKESVPMYYELGFISPDKKKRLFVKKNHVGSFSYQLDILTLVQPNEIEYFDSEAYWEPDLRTPASFYDSIESLLKDIEYIIKDWKKIE